MRRLYLLALFFKLKLWNIITPSFLVVLNLGTSKSNFKPFKVIPLNTEHSYSNVGIKCKDNMLEIGASEEVIQEKNGQKSMSKSHFKNSFSIPAGTIKNKIRAETIGSKIIVRGEAEKKSQIEDEKATEIPINFE